MKFIFISLFLMPVFTFAWEISVASGEWPPYTSKNLPAGGFCNDLVSKLNSEIGADTNLGYFPWERAKKLLIATNKWQVSTCWSFAEKRKDIFYFTELPITKLKTVFFYRKGKNFDWKTHEDLKNYTFGILKAYVFEKKFDEMVRNKAIKHQEVLKEEQNFLKVLSGRIDAFPSDLTVGLTKIREMLKNKVLTEKQAAEITWHPKAVIEQPIYLVLNKKTGDEKVKEILKKYNKKLAEWKKNGKLKELQDKLKDGFYE